MNILNLGCIHYPQDLWVQTGLRGSSYAISIPVLETWRYLGGYLSPGWLLLAPHTTTEMEITVVFVRAGWEEGARGGKCLPSHPAEMKTLQPGEEETLPGQKSASPGLGMWERRRIKESNFSFPPADCV